MWIRTDIASKPTSKRGCRLRLPWNRRIVVECDQCGTEATRAFEASHRMKDGAATFCSNSCKTRSDWKSPGYSERMTLANRLSWSDPERGAARRAKHSETMSRPEMLTRRAESIRAAYKAPELLARTRKQLASLRDDADVQRRRAESGRTAWGTPERRAQKSALFKALWSDPTFAARTRAACQAAMNTPEYKANLSSAVKEWQSDPARNGKHIASRAAFLADPVRVAARAKKAQEWHADLGADATWRAKISAAHSTAETKARMRATLRANNSFVKSGPEDRLHDYLTETMATVVRQSMLNGWAMDFYVPSADTYIQLDGVYWHGLSRQIIKIAEMKSKQDVGIYQTYCTDVQQNEYCRANGIRLVRITDKELIALEKRGTVADWLAAEFPQAQAG